MIMRDRLEISMVDECRSYCFGFDILFTFILSDILI